METKLICWMEIESAPRDGTWVLLKGGTTNEQDYDERGFSSERPVVAKWYVWRWTDNEFGGEGWVFGVYDGFCSLEYENPTHWARVE